MTFEEAYKRYITDKEIELDERVADKLYQAGCNETRMHHKENETKFLNDLISLSHYAELEGITPMGARKRAKLGKIQVVKIDGKRFVKYKKKRKK